jgi:hypothetical protein
MKANLLSFPFINFSESGLLNGLRAKKIKKSGVLSGVALWVLGKLCAPGSPILFHSFLSACRVGDRVRHRH